MRQNFVYRPPPQYRSPQLYRRNQRRNQSWLYAPATQQIATIAMREITAATQANPCQITVTGHGLTTGAQGRIWDVGGMTQLNNAAFSVTAVNANTLTLGVNSTAYGAYTGGGFLSFGRSLLENASPAAADGDILVVDLLTDHGYTIDLRADGGVTINSGGDTARQSFGARYYKVALGAFTDDAPVTFFDGNLPPVLLDSGGLGFIVGQVFSYDLTALFEDPEDDVMDVRLRPGETIPAFLDISSSILRGVSGSVVDLVLPLRAYDSCGDFTDVDLPVSFTLAEGQRYRNMTTTQRTLRRRILL